MRVFLPHGKRGFSPSSMSDIAFLLIIFLLVTVSIESAGNISLPSFRYAKESEASDPASIVMDRGGAIALGDRGVTERELADALSAMGKTFPGGISEMVVHVQADKDLPFKKVNALLESLDRAGCRNIVLVAEPGQP